MKTRKFNLNWQSVLLGMVLCAVLVVFIGSKAADAQTRHPAAGASPAEGGEHDRRLGKDRRPGGAARSPWTNGSSASSRRSTNWTRT